MPPIRKLGFLPALEMGEILPWRHQHALAFPQLPLAPPVTLIFLLQILAGSPPLPPSLPPSPSCVASPSPYSTADPSPPPVSQHSPSDQRQPLLPLREEPGCGKQQPSSAPGFSVPQLCTEPGFSLFTPTCILLLAALLLLYHPGAVLDIPASRWHLVPPLASGVAPHPIDPGEPTASSRCRHVARVAPAATEGPCSLLDRALSKAGLGSAVLCGCLVSGL